MFLEIRCLSAVRELEFLTICERLSLGTLTLISRRGVREASPALGVAFAAFEEGNPKVSFKPDN